MRRGCGTSLGGAGLRASVRGAAARGAFTLIEVLLSLSIVLALSALALPSMMGWLDRLEPEAVSAQIAGGIGYCRGDAMRTGKAMTLISLYDGERCRLYGLPLTETSGMGSPTAGDVTGVETPASESAGWAGVPTIDDLARAMEYVALPVGVVLERAEPPSADADGSAMVAASDADSRDAGVRGAGVRREHSREPFYVAIVLPDGTIVDAGGNPLTVDLGKVGVRGVEINRWTGETTLGAAPVATPKEEKEPEEEPEVPVGVPPGAPEDEEGSR